MALSPLPSNLLPPTSTSPTSPSFSMFNPQTHSPNSFSSLNFRVFCSQQTIQLPTPQPKKKRKPKPSFADQIRQKWSVKTPIVRHKFPWQEQELQIEPIEDDKEEEEDDDDDKSHQSLGVAVTESDSCENSLLSDQVSFVPINRTISAPWVHGKEPNKTQFDSFSIDLDNSIDGFQRDTEGSVSSIVQESSKLGRGVGFDGKTKAFVETDETSIGLSERKEKAVFKNVKRASFNGKSASVNQGVYSLEGSSDKIDSKRLPWERGSDLGSVDGDRPRKGNAMLSEKLVPETELRRLRNVALRMVERLKVGAAGVTQALVDSIHEKWKEDEVVKLKFEGPSTLNMKRIHETLETRTGGLVIWRSGSSVVLYRGMSYNLPCVQSYAKQNQVNTMISRSSSGIVSGDLTQRVGLEDSVRTADVNKSTRHLKKLSEKEITDLSEVDHLLEDLGPRYKDWSGPEPLPVDADLLPSVVPGYKRPFRLLPHGFRYSLRDKHVTYYRRTARIMPPHFALGRNRELQGLARAMVKLWEISAIAKIAIKRGVHNTCNERMAEELKRLTGGTLLSRNKDYIVFYRGNDFLPPAVSKTLVEAHKLTVLQQDEEEKIRSNASPIVHSTTKASKVQLVAGTLSETMAATSLWGNQPSSQDIEKMKKDSALARHASFVRYLEMKLNLAKGKIKKAEKALAKVQESLEPAELPSDLETISDEERFLFRKIGLSMKPYLILGRRGIFDGTVENIHLHWKYRELVKLLVERKSFPQVKHIAIALEAESGGVLVTVDKTMKGHVIILYRGKNYQPPVAFRPKNLLSRRQALARSIELQRREALKHHISDLTVKIEKLKSELDDMKTVNEIDEDTFYSRVDDASSSEDEMEEDEDEDFDEDEEAYLEVHDSGNDDSNI
ncbi:hypothetical protein C3L33_03558, partial [Rhododendron williamsianum]